MSSPLEELKAMASIKDRIDAIAKDLKSRVKKYDEISSKSLLRALGEEPDEGDMVDYRRAMSFRDVDDWRESFLETLCDYVSTERANAIKAWLALYLEGEVDEDAFELTADEEEIIQTMLNIKRCEDLPDYGIRTWSFDSSEGSSFSFRGFVGDSGDVSLTGPYEDEEDEEGICMDDYFNFSNRDLVADLVAEQKKRKAIKSKRAKTSKNKKK